MLERLTEYGVAVVLSGVWVADIDPVLTGSENNGPDPSGVISGRQLDLLDRR